MFQYNASNLGQVGGSITNFNYHEPTIITIQSGIWEYTRNDTLSKDTLVLNFTTDKSNFFERVEVDYNLKGNATQEGEVLNNIVPILNLRDASNNPNFQKEIGVVPNKVWNDEKKAWEVKNEEKDHDPNLRNKRLGVIFFQNWFLNAKGELKSNTKIYAVYDEKTRQTGLDIALGREHHKDDTAHLIALCEEANQVSNSRREKAIAKQRMLAQTNKANDDKPLPVVGSPTEYNNSITMSDEDIDFSTDDNQSNHKNDDSDSVVISDYNED